jgi:hypothetical protein
MDPMKLLLQQERHSIIPLRGIATAHDRRGDIHRAAGSVQGIH